MVRSTFRSRLMTILLVAIVTVTLSVTRQNSTTVRAEVLEKALVSIDAVTHVLSYQGRLVDPVTGVPKADGSYSMTFRIYDDAAAGTILWTEIKDVAVSKGLFSTLLGDTTALAFTVFDGNDRWLGVKVGADAETTPRMRMAFAPYASWAANTGALNGQNGLFYRNASNINAGTLADAQIPPVITRDGEVMGIVTAADGAGSGVDADLLDGQDSTAFVKTVGSGTISGGNDSAAMLYVKQTGSQDGLFATTESTDSGEGAVHGRAGAGGPTINSVAGVVGDSSSGRGVVGTSTNKEGVLGFSTNDVGVNGQSSNSNGVEGLAGGSTGVVYGVKGVSNSNHNSSAGVRGESSQVGVWGNSSGYVGVWGSSAGRWAVYGATTGTASSYGVYGTAPSGTGNYAGYFSGGARVVGNLEVTGSVSKGSGSFKIDHPLDPENKYLYHSFVESPDMMNVYNGNATLGSDGTAWVELPSYFETLNRDFRYQLTAIGGPGPNLYVAQEVQGNRFQIAGGASDLRVSWQVTGIRQDPFAEANPIIAEVEKPESERGTYLYPELYGVERSRGLDYRFDSAAPGDPTQPMGGLEPEKSSDAPTLSLP